MAGSWRAVVATTSVSAKFQFFSPTAYSGFSGAPDFDETWDLVVAEIDLRGNPVPKKASPTAPLPLAALVDEIRGRCDADGTLSYDMDGLLNDCLDEIDERYDVISLAAEVRLIPESLLLLALLGTD